MLLALAGVDRHRLVRQSGFLQEESNLCWVWRRVEIEADHESLPSGWTFRKSGTNGWTFGSEANADSDYNDRSPLGWQRYLAEHWNCEQRDDRWQERDNGRCRRKTEQGDGAV